MLMSSIPKKYTESGQKLKNRRKTIEGKKCVKKDAPKSGLCIDPIGEKLIYQENYVMITIQHCYVVLSYPQGK